MKKNNGPVCVLPVLIILIVPGFLTSCRDFFSSSLFPGAVRDPGELVPQVTPKNVDELVRKAENDPDLALAVLWGIRDALGRVSPEEASRLRAAALKAAAAASAIGPSLLNNAGKISASMDRDKAIGLVAETLEAMTNLPATGDALLALVPDPKKDKENFDSFMRASQGDDLAIASLTLVAVEIKGRGMDLNQYVKTLDPSVPRSPTENLAMEFARGAIKKIGPDGTHSFVRDLLRELNLV
jgi:hypothetical protein